MQMQNSSPASAARSRLLRPEEVAEILNVRPATLSAWRTAGTGPAVTKVMGAVRYDEADLDAFLAACRRSPSAS